MLKNKILPYLREVFDILKFAMLHSYRVIQLPWWRISMRSQNFGMEGGWITEIFVSSM